VNEIGGNKVLLKDRDTKIFLDFGMSFALRDRYYSAPFLCPKSERGLLEFGILPRVEGVYEFDDSEPDLDCVFLSHSHMDHSAYISFLKEVDPCPLRGDYRDHPQGSSRDQDERVRVRYRRDPVQDLQDRG